MNRLQKKCLIAVAGTHLFLLVLLLCSGFFRPRPKDDNLQLLDVIPATAIDAAFTSGVKGAQAPPPTPAINPPPQPSPPQPRQVATPPPAPAPSLMQKMENLFKPEPEKLSPDELKPTETESKPKEHKIQVDLKPVVRQSSEDSAAQSDTRERQRERERELQRVLRSLKSNLSTATEIEMPGNSSVAYANYAQIVKSIYDQAWLLPENVDYGNATTKVKVVIARNGSVISSQIIETSGNAALDETVQRALDRVSFVAPFPDNSQESERSYIIGFNPQTKQMSE